MADGRMLRRKIALDKDLARLSRDRTRLFFTWCLPHLDVQGRLTGDPDVLKVTVAPFLKTFTPKTIAQDIAECHEVGLVRAYVVDGERYLWFPGFLKNQQLRPDREAKSQIPAPPEEGDARASDGACGSTPGALRESTGSTPPEVKSREEKGSKCAEGDFEAFWSHYPRKRSKEDARKAWDAVRPTAWQAAVLMSAVAAASTSNEWQQDGGRFVPYAATWLRGRRWEDCLDAAPVPAPAAPVAPRVSESARIRQLEEQFARERQDGAEWHS